MPRLRISAHRSKVSTQEDFGDGNSFYRFGRDPKGFDILPAIPGVDFDGAWERRVETLVDAATGLMANFISAEDLIASKLASGRARDLADVEEIRKAVEASGRPARYDLIAIQQPISAARPSPVTLLSQGSPTQMRPSFTIGIEESSFTIGIEE